MARSSSCSNESFDSVKVAILDEFGSYQIPNKGSES
jgi:hypothetical protein